MNYIIRQLETKLMQYIKQFPIVVLTGARQSGKSTLLKHLFSSDDWEYINLDQRGILEQINSDPDLFIKDIRSNIIIDEAQKSPNLFHSIKWKIDEGMKYKIILSGSANFHLLQKVTETLAGRAGILELYPLSLSEKHKQHNLLDLLINTNNINELKNKLKKINLVKDDDIFLYILWGGYPKLLEYKNSEFKLNWFENYRTTYIERDLRDLAQIADLSDFQRFYQLLAFQTGNILNLSNIANEIGITVPTCKKYMQILELSYQYFLLKPYYSNIRKRLIKSPKIYCMDTGLCNFFLENSSRKLLMNSSKLGNLFENSVIVDIMKQNSFLNKKCNMYYWRTSNGTEIDLVIEHGENLIPIEIKSSIKISSVSIRGLTDFLVLKINKKIPYGIVIYRGDRVSQISDKILAVPIGYL